MHAIHHRLVMSGSREAVFAGLTRAVATLAAETGAIVRMLTCDGDARIVWRCVDGPEDWVGTEIAVELSREPHGTAVRFAHRHWRAAGDVLASCATRWARMLFGLECAVALPEPDDTRV